MSERILPIGLQPTGIKRVGNFWSYKDSFGPLNLLAQLFFCHGINYSSTDYLLN